ncbi:MAG: hypothetical protein K0S27_5 [Gammaproteobacteria bacterium]|jgi:hypothetical protein|nr:hypothetical protein [Gammaproteobacteria bacterium]
MRFQLSKLWNLFNPATKIKLADNLPLTKTETEFINPNKQTKIIYSLDYKNDCLNIIFPGTHG